MKKHLERKKERKGENFIIIPMPGGYGCPGDRRAYDSLRLEETLAQLFQRTLTGAALRWFLSLDDKFKKLGGHMQ